MPKSTQLVDLIRNIYTLCLAFYTHIFTKALYSKFPFSMDYKLQLTSHRPQPKHSRCINSAISRMRTYSYVCMCMCIYCLICMRLMIEISATGIGGSTRREIPTRAVLLLLNKMYIKNLRIWQYWKDSVQK